MQTILALLAVGIAAFTLTPLMYNLKSNTALWANASDQALQIRDNLYDIYFFVPVMLVGVVVVFAFMSATRKQPDEV